MNACWCIISELGPILAHEPLLDAHMEDPGEDGRVEEAFWWSSNELLGGGYLCEIKPTAFLLLLPWGTDNPLKCQGTAQDNFPTVRIQGRKLSCLWEIQKLGSCTPRGRGSTLRTVYASKHRPALQRCAESSKERVLNLSCQKYQAEFGRKAETSRKSSLQIVSAIKLMTRKKEI